MSKLSALCMGLVLAGSLIEARAANIDVVRRLDGYTCMMLNQTPDEAINPAYAIHVFSEPRQGATPVGIAMPVVAVKSPIQQVNGFLSALFPNGKTVWIPAASLRPYHSLGDPAAKCAPALMSNGLQGFYYFH